MNTTDDAVISDFRDWIAATEIPKADQVSGFDKFVSLPSLVALQAFERDRGFYVQIIQGPYPKPGTTCMNRVHVYVGVRFFNDFASQARMLRDVPALRLRMRAAVPKSNDPGTPHVTGLNKVEVSGPLHDYQTIEKGDLVVFDVVLDYHVEVS